MDCEQLLPCPPPPPLPVYMGVCVSLFAPAVERAVTPAEQVVDGSAKLIARVVELAHKYYKKVPVLVITSSQAQLGKVHAALKAAGELPPDEVQRLSEFDEGAIPV